VDVIGFSNKTRVGNEPVLLFAGPAASRIFLYARVVSRVQTAETQTMGGVCHRFLGACGGGGCKHVVVMFCKRFSFQTPAASQDKTDDVNVSCDRINLKTSATDVAHDYTKRKHVMRLCSSADAGCTELLLQTDDASSMVRWLKALQEQALDVQPPPSSLSAEEVSPSVHATAFETASET